MKRRVSQVAAAKKSLRQTEREAMIRELSTVEMDYHLEVLVKELIRGIVVREINSFNDANDRYRIIVGGGEAVYYYFATHLNAEDKEFLETHDYDLRFIPIGPRSDAVEWFYQRTDPVYRDKITAATVGPVAGLSAQEQDYVREIRREDDRVAQAMLAPITAITEEVDALFSKISREATKAGYEYRLEIEISDRGPGNPADPRPWISEQALTYNEDNDFWLQTLRPLLTLRVKFSRDGKSAHFNIVDLYPDLISNRSNLGTLHPLEPTLDGKDPARADTSDDLLSKDRFEGAIELATAMLESGNSFVTGLSNAYLEEELYQAKNGLYYPSVGYMIWDTVRMLFYSASEVYTQAQKYLPCVDNDLQLVAMDIIQANPKAGLNEIVEKLRAEKIQIGRDVISLSALNVEDIRYAAEAALSCVTAKRQIARAKLRRYIRKFWMVIRVLSKTSALCNLKPCEELRRSRR